MPVMASNRGRMTAEDTLEYKRKLNEADLRAKVTADLFARHQAAIKAGVPPSVLPSIQSLGTLSQSDQVKMQESIARWTASKAAMATGVANGVDPVRPVLNADAPAIPMAGANGVQKVWQSPALRATMAGDVTSATAPSTTSQTTVKPFNAAKDKQQWDKDTADFNELVRQGYYSPTGKALKPVPENWRSGDTQYIVDKYGVPGTEVAVRNLPESAPGFINGVQVDGAPQAGFKQGGTRGAERIAQYGATPAGAAVETKAAARTRGAADAATGEARKAAPTVATTPTRDGTALTMAQAPTQFDPTAARVAAIMPPLRMPTGIPAAVDDPSNFDITTGAPKAPPSGAEKAGTFARRALTAAVPSPDIVTATATGSPLGPVAPGRAERGLLPAISEAASGFVRGFKSPAQTPLGVTNEQAAGFTKPTKAYPLPVTPTTPVADIDDTKDAIRRFGRGRATMAFGF